MARIIDADGHIVEPRKLWEEYVEPEFRDRVVRIERNREGFDEFWVGNERRRGPGGSIIASVIPGGYLDPERTRTAAWEDILPGSWDPHARIKVLDEEGIDVSFLYPSFYLIYGVSSAKTRRPSCGASQEAVLVVKSVEDGVRHHAAGPVEAMALALQ